MTDHELERLLTKLPGPITTCAIYSDSNNGIPQPRVTVVGHSNSVRFHCASIEAAAELASKLREIREAARLIEE